MLGWGGMQASKHARMLTNTHAHLADHVHKGSQVVVQGVALLHAILQVEAVALHIKRHIVLRACGVALHACAWGAGRERCAPPRPPRPPPPSFIHCMQPLRGACACAPTPNLTLSSRLEVACSVKQR